MPDHGTLHRSKLFPSSWVSIVQTRFFLCLVLITYSLIDPNIKSKERLWSLIAAYFVFNLSLRLLKSERLSLKRVRLIPAVVDVVFTSLLISNSTGPGNSWFLLYIF